MVTAVGTIIKEILQTSRGSKATFKVYETARHEYVASIEYDPGVDYRSNGAAWIGLVPEPPRPHALSMHQLKSEFCTDLALGRFYENIVIDHHVSQAMHEWVADRQQPEV